MCLRVFAHTFVSRARRIPSKTAQIENGWTMYRNQNILRCWMHAIFRFEGEKALLSPVSFLFPSELCTFSAQAWRPVAKFIEKSRNSTYSTKFQLSESRPTFTSAVLRHTSAVPPKAFSKCPKCPLSLPVPSPNREKNLQAEASSLPSFPGQVLPKICHFNRRQSNDRRA